MCTTFPCTGRRPPDRKVLSSARPKAATRVPICTKMMKPRRRKYHAASASRRAWTRFGPPPQYVLAIHPLHSLTRLAEQCVRHTTTRRRSSIPVLPRAPPLQAGANPADESRRGPAKGGEGRRRAARGGEGRRWAAKGCEGVAKGVASVRRGTALPLHHSPLPPLGGLDRIILAVAFQ